jgi:hypothetical protein
MWFRDTSWIFLPEGKISSRFAQRLGNFTQRNDRALVQVEQQALVLSTTPQMSANTAAHFDSGLPRHPPQI